MTDQPEQQIDLHTLANSGATQKLLEYTTAEELNAWESELNGEDQPDGK